MLWFEFIASAVLIISAGALLTTYADRLSDKLNISGAFVGLIILSIISSLPELGTTISVVKYVGKPDLAAGNIFGSNTFNILILAVLDFLLGAASLFALSRVSHQKSIALAVLMTIVAVLAIRGDGIFFIDGAQLDSFVLLMVYFIGIYFLFLAEKKARKPDHKYGSEKVGKEILVVVLSGLVVVISGYWLARISDGISEVTGWGESFVGYIFLAVTTSLPELVISISSLKLKAYDMAIANTIGSCFFNVLMFAIADPFYDGSLLADTSPYNIRLGLVSIAMLVVTAVALMAGSRGKNTGWTKYLLVVLYVLGSWLVFSAA